METLSQCSDYISMRAWVRIDGGLHRKTIIRSYEEPHVLLYITKALIENDEKVPPPSEI